MLNYLDLIQKILNNFQFTKLSDNSLYEKYTLHSNYENVYNFLRDDPFLSSFLTRMESKFLLCELPVASLNNKSSFLNVEFTSSGAATILEYKIINRGS